MKASRANERRTAMSVTGSVVSIRMPEYSPPTIQWNMITPCSQGIQLSSPRLRARA